jgi:hypothetical protein
MEDRVKDREQALNLSARRSPNGRRLTASKRKACVALTPAWCTPFDEKIDPAIPIPTMEVAASRPTDTDTTHGVSSLVVFEGCT